MGGLHTLPANQPNTDGQLFDAMHEWYGVGDYNEDATGADADPWWKWRAAEIGKVKRSRLTREASLPDLYVALLYCKAHNLHVEGVTWLYRHIPRAWAWWDRKEATTLHDDQAEAFADAVRIEAANPDATWLGRLLRAAPAQREEVLAQWQAQWKV